MHATRIVVGALVLAAGCEVPTGLPRWQETWNLPARATAISVGSLLPASVAITADSSAFTAAIAPIAITRELGQDCSACAAANGTMTSKPAFTIAVTDNTALPAGVDSATLVGDTLTVAVRNGFDFDPLRPSATTRGNLVLSISEGALAIARDSVDGATTAMPPGSTLVRRIPLAGTLAGNVPLAIAATLHSPQGDSVLVDSADSLVVTVPADSLLLSSASVAVQNQSVTAAPVTLDMSAIGSSVSSRVQSGALDLALSNPFGVEGTATVYLTGTSTSGQRIDLSRSIVVPSAASSSVSVSFTQAEAQELIGAKIVLQMSGAVSGPGGVVTVTPREALGIDTRFDVVVNTASMP